MYARVVYVDPVLEWVEQSCLDPAANPGPELVAWPTPWRGRPPSVPVPEWGWGLSGIPAPKRSKSIEPVRVLPRGEHGRACYVKMPVVPVEERATGAGAGGWPLPGADCKADVQWWHEVAGGGGLHARCDWSEEEESATAYLTWGARPGVWRTAHGTFPPWRH